MIIEQLSNIQLDVTARPRRMTVTAQTLILTGCIFIANIFDGRHLFHAKRQLAPSANKGSFKSSFKLVSFRCFRAFEIPGELGWTQFETCLV